MKNRVSVVELFILFVCFFSPMSWSMEALDEEGTPSVGLIQSFNNETTCLACGQKLGEEHLLLHLQKMSYLELENQVKALFLKNHELQNKIKDLEAERETCRVGRFVLEVKK